MSSPPTRAEILAAWDGLGGTPPKNFAEWCRAIGSSRGNAWHTLTGAGRIGTRTGGPEPVEAPPDLPPAAIPGIVEREEGDAGLTVKFQSDAIVTTLDDLILKAQADMTVWRVSTWKAKAYTVPIRVRRGQGPDGKQLADEPHVKSMWLITASFERIPADEAERAAALEAIYARFDAKAPHYEPVAYPEIDRPYSCLIGMEDVHLGKRCWGREVGRDFDLRIAKEYYRETFADLLSRAAASYGLAEIVITVGSDLTHVDTGSLTTTAGTQMQADGRFELVWETAEELLFWAFSDAAKIAPVRGIWKPGNHDYRTSYGLARTVKARFHNHPNISFDIGPNPHKYHRFGTNLIGLVHGDKIKPDKLPRLMMRERPRDMADTTCHEILIGHRHASEKWVDSFNGVIVRQLRSLSETDDWHNSEGFLSDDQAAEAYIYHRDRGFTANLIARPTRPGAYAVSEIA